MISMPSMRRWNGLAAVAFLAACGSSAAAEPRAPQAVDAGDLRTSIAPSPADTLSAARLSSAFRAAADVALPAVVSIRVTEEARGFRRGQQRIFPFLEIPELPIPSQSQGSGVIFDARGYILTNRHVVRDADEVIVQLGDGREYEATVVGTDPNTDVAVIKIEPGSGERLPVARFGDSDALEVGDWVLALGNPLGLGITVTAGIVSAKARSIGILRRENETALEAFIQTDAAINPGNSGGPLVDLSGRVVGINTAIASQTGFYSGYGFAIPIALAQRVADDLIEHGAVRRPRLGVSIQDVDAADAEVYGLDEVAGAEVVMVQPNTAAERAGLKIGDVIIALDGQPIRTGTELTASLARRRPGEKVRLTVVRDKSRRELTVELGEFETSTSRVAKGSERTSTAEVLGFQAAPLTPERAQQYGIEKGEGVVVVGLTPLSPAGSRGVQRGHLIVKINGKDVRSMRDLENAARSIKPGDVVSLIVRTPNGEEQIINYRTRR